MSVTLLLWGTRCLRPSLPFKFSRTTPFASSNAPSQASPPDSHFSLEYLVQSCGLSSHEALKASKYIQHLKSPDKPDAVLRFLREIGVRDSDIRTAVSRDSRILFSHVEKNWKPNVAKLQELGFSIDVISDIISCCPTVFRSNFVPKLEFWSGILGSRKNLTELLKAHKGVFVARNLEKVLIPNLSFLKEQCGLSPSQILRLVKWAPRLVSCKLEVLKKHAESADELGVARSSGAFVNALIVVSNLNQSIIDARLNNLKSLGLSLEEIAILTSKVPFVLYTPEEVISRKMEFLIKEAGCDKSHLISNPALLTYNLENRLIPRSLVRKLLTSKGLPVANLKLATFVKPSEEDFVEKFVLPYENVVPGLHRAYADAGKIKGIA